MNKIYKLFINENIKTWKKISTKILMIVILLALIGTLGIVKFVKYMNEKVESTYSSYDWRESSKTEIENLKKALENEYLDDEVRKSYQMQIEMYEMALEYDITPYSNYWKSDILNEMTNMSSERRDESEISKLKELIKSNNYTGYIEIQKQRQKESLDRGEITQEEYNDQISILEMKAKYEIGKKQGETYWKTALLGEIQSYQRSLRTGIDFENSKALTVEKKQEYEDSIKMNIYRLENNKPTLDYAENNYRMIFETLAPGFTVAVLAIAAIIIAGGEISTESSTGTIKFWALTPNKRWKILTAKILSVLFYIIVITLIISILSIACSNIFFEGDGNEYIYVKDGEVKVIGNALYTIETYFAKTIPVIMFALLAIMLSTVTRNTAVAVSFSVAIYMGNSIAMGILNQFIKQDWIKFVPFNNLNIVGKIFTNAENPMQMFGPTFATSTSLQFSLGVLTVCAILMLVTMYDSFNKKDII